MIFTDFHQCLWLLENLLISKFTEVPTCADEILWELVKDKDMVFSGFFLLPVDLFILLQRIICI